MRGRRGSGRPACRGVAARRDPVARKCFFPNPRGTLVSGTSLNVDPDRVRPGARAADALVTRCVNAGPAASCGHQPSASMSGQGPGHQSEDSRTPVNRLQTARADSLAGRDDWQGLSAHARRTVPLPQPRAGHGRGGRPPRPNTLGVPADSSWSSATKIPQPPDVGGCRRQRVARTRHLWCQPPTNPGGGGFRGQPRMTAPDLGPGNPVVADPGGP